MAAAGHARPGRRGISRYRLRLVTGLALALAGAALAAAQARPIGADPAQAASNPTSAQLLASGAAAFEAGLYEVAARSFAQLLATAPDAPEAVAASFLEALSLFYAGAAPAARARLLMHQRRFPDSPYGDQLWYWIGAAAQAEDDPQAALEALERHLRQVAAVDGDAGVPFVLDTRIPFVVHVRDTQARALEQLGRREEAFQLYEELLAAADGADGAGGAGGPVGAGGAGGESAASAGQVDDATRARWMERSGALLLATQRYAEAADRYRRIVTEFPRTPPAPDALFYLAEAEYFAGNPTAAADRYRLYLEVFPAGPHRIAAAYRLTRVALAGDDPEAAQSAWLQLERERTAAGPATAAPASAGHDPVALAALEGDVHAAAGDWAGAVAAYRAGLAAGPEPGPRQVLTLNVALALVEQGDPQQAAAVFARTADGPDAGLAETALFNAALILVQQQRLAEGAGALARFLDRYPDSARLPQVEELLIAVHERAGDHQALLGDLERIARRRRLTAAEQQQRGFALLQTGDDTAALAALTRSAPALPAAARAESRYRIGAVYARRGEHARAAPYFAEVAADQAAGRELRQRAVYAWAVSHFNVGDYQPALEVLAQLTGAGAGEDTGAGAAGATPATAPPPAAWLAPAEFATAAALYRLGRVADAAVHFDRAAAAYRRGASTVPAEAPDPAHTAESWRALALFQSGELTTARVLFRELAGAAAAANAAAVHWYRAGLASTLLADYGAAEREFADALAAVAAADPLRPEILYETVRLALRRGDAAAAAAAVQRLEAAFAGHRLTTIAQLQRADALRQQGRLHEAAAAFAALAVRAGQPGSGVAPELEELARYAAIEALATAEGAAAAREESWQYLLVDPGAARAGRVAELLRAGLVAAPAMAQEFYERVSGSSVERLDLPPVLVETVQLAYAEVLLASDAGGSERVLQQVLDRLTLAGERHGAAPSADHIRVEAMLLLGRAYEAARKWTQAAELYRGLALSEQSAVAAHGALGGARVLLPGDPAAAAQEYGAVAIRFEAFPEVAGEAWFLGAAAHRAAGNEEGEALFIAQLYTRASGSSWARRAAASQE